MKNGAIVAAFEREFAARVNARHAIAMTNGTVTLEVALRCMGAKAGVQVQTTPLTMASTTIAILNTGAMPRYHDVDPNTWLLDAPKGWATYLPVSLYGLHAQGMGLCHVDDAAQTLRPHSHAAFTSYSLQRSKILNTGEGGVLVTNHDFLAAEARSIASLGYSLTAAHSTIDKATLKSPTYERHRVWPSMNARMNDVTAGEGLRQLEVVDFLVGRRTEAALLYFDAIGACPWLTRQETPLDSQHDWWAFPVACDTPERAIRLCEAVAKHGGETPYPAWLLSFAEPAFRHLDPGLDACLVARSLQPRILAFQTNNPASAEQNARALRKAIEELS